MAPFTHNPFPNIGLSKAACCSMINKNIACLIQYHVVLIDKTKKGMLAKSQRCKLCQQAVLMAVIHLFYSAYYRAT